MTLCYCYRAAMDDAALTRSLCTGTDSAVDSLFDRFAPSLYSYCLTLLSTPESAAEALSNTLLAAVDRVEGLAEPRRLEVWLFALARNECLRILRRSGRRLPGTHILDGVSLRSRLPRRRDRDEEGGLAEIHELIHRHRFDDRAVAAVLGISLWHATMLARRGETSGTGSVHEVARRGADTLPDGLRERVLVDAAEPVRTMFRGELAGPFRRSGFPVPLDRSGRGRRSILAVAAVVALLALGTAAVSPSLASDHEVVLTVGEPINGPLPDELLPPTPATSGPPTSGKPTTPAPSTPPPSAPAIPGQAAPTRSTRPPPAPRPPAPPPAPRIPPPATGVITGIGGGCVEVVSGGGIELLSCDGTSSQQWTVGGDGTLHAFRSCMNVRDGGTANGTSVNLSKCNSSGAQQWLTGPNASLINPQSGKCLDGPNNSGDPRRLEIWTCNGGAYQRWTLPG